MGTTKYAIVRYLALDRCFRNTGRDYSIADLLQVCNEALMSVVPDSKGIKKRQLYEDIRFMESEEGYSIDLVKKKSGREVFYRYRNPNFSINRQGLNQSEAAQIKEALLVLSRFQGVPQFEWVDETVAKLESNFGLKKGASKIIAFDENKDYVAVKHISTLFNSILYERTLKITYRAFNQETPSEIIFHPYFLKEYNNRWFCFGLHNERKEISNLALDRMVEIFDYKTKYIKNKDVDFNEYFEDVVGVTVEGNIQKITLKVKKELWPYILTKPLHGSQKTKLIEKEYVLISIEVKPNYELESLILSHGNKMEVIEPEVFRNRLLTRLR